MTDIPDIGLNYVRSLTEAHAFYDWLRTVNEPVGIDTETSGVDWQTSDTRVLCIGTRDQGWAIPVKEWWQVADDAMRYVHDKQLRTVFHNVTFDMHALRNAGLQVPDDHQVVDTMIALRMIDLYETAALKEASGLYLGPWAVIGQDVLDDTMQRHGWTWATIPTYNEDYLTYAALDPVLTVRLASELPFDPDEAYWREVAYALIMHRVERRGLRVDTELAQRTLAYYRLNYRHVTENLSINYGISSPWRHDEIGNALMARGYMTTKHTPTGKPSWDQSVLKSIDHEITELVLRARELDKLATTYLAPFAECGGTVHPNIRTLRARTGRTGVSNPPLQQLPSDRADIRECIIPPEGTSFYLVDYDAQELRLFAELSGEQAMIDEFNSSEPDLHSKVADQLGISRTVAKTFNFALIYGAGDKKLAETTGLSIPEVRQVLAQYWAQYPAVRPWMQRTQAAASVTTVGGRTLSLHPDDRYKAVNYLIQGSGADVTKQAAISIAAAGYEDAIVLPVHDELVLALHNDEQAKECATMMEYPLDHLTLTTGTSGPWSSWGEAYKEAP